MESGQGRRAAGVAHNEGLTGMDRESGDCLSGAREVPLARSPDGRRARAAARWRRCHCSAHSPERTRWSAARPSCCFLQLGPLLYRPRRPTHIYSLLRPPTLFCITLPRQQRPEREYDLTHLNQDGVRVVCASQLEREKCLCALLRSPLIT